MSEFNQPQAETVEVITGSRLHFGLFTDQPPTGFGRRSFGGIGVMIDEPNWSLRVSRREDNDVINVTDRAVNNASSSASSTNEQSHEPCAQDYIERAASIIQEFRRQQDVAPIELEIRRVVPAHLGYGSGTQFALTIARALDELEGNQTQAAKLALMIGRGKRSAVGTWGFDLGGLIVDGGKCTSDSVGALVGRIEIPTEWRFVLLSDSERIGINGEHESKAFAQSPGMPQELTDTLCRIALTEIAPAFAESEYRAAAQALDEYGNRVGRYFSDIQGGTFSSHDVARAVAQLRFDGVTGITQTSWGPTCSVLCANESNAKAIEARINAVAGNVSAKTVQPLNTGARVTRA